MLYKDLPERIQKIAQIEKKRCNYKNKIENDTDVLRFFWWWITRQWADARSEVSLWRYTLIDKRLDMKNKAKGHRKPIGIRYWKLPKEVQNILLRYDIRFNDRLNNKKTLDMFTLLELIDCEKSKIPRDVVEKANIWDYEDILEWDKNNSEYSEWSFRF